MPQFDDKKLYIWAKAVYLFWGFRCACCGSRNDLEAHHIKPKSLYPHLAYNVRNGICLCRRCHREAKWSLHSKIKLTKCNKRTLAIWLKFCREHKNRKPYAGLILTLAIIAIVLYVIMKGN